MDPTYCINFKVTFINFCKQFFSQMLLELSHIFCQLLVRRALTWLPFLSQCFLRCFALRNLVYTIHPLIHFGFFSFSDVSLQCIQSSITVLFCSSNLKCSDLVSLLPLSNLASCQHEAILVSSCQFSSSPWLFVSSYTGTVFCLCLLWSVQTSLPHALFHELLTIFYFFHFSCTSLVDSIVTFIQPKVNVKII